MKNEATLKVGDPVVVARGLSVIEKRLLGRRFIIQRFDTTHGYAVVRSARGSWHVHPEALDIYEGPEA